MIFVRLDSYMLFFAFCFIEIVIGCYPSNNVNVVFHGKCRESACTGVCKLPYLLGLELGTVSSPHSV